MSYKSGIDLDRAILNQLTIEREPHVALWREVADNFFAQKIMYNRGAKPQSTKINHKIIDSTPVQSLETLSAGMQAGITSPARPWFKMTTPDPELAEFGSVKVYLDNVTNILRARFLRSNLYNVTPTSYKYMGSLGTAAYGIEEDLRTFMRCIPFKPGSYCLSNNGKLRVDTFTREFPMTVKQIVQKFGIEPNDPLGKKIKWDNISYQVKNAWDQGQYEQWFNIIQIIKPNLDPDRSGYGLSKDKLWSSCYFEAGNFGGSQQNYFRSGDEKRYLLEEGYDYFPIIAPRWMLDGDSAYACSSPGMNALGDAKQLQTGEKKELKAIDKMVDPALMADASLKQSKVSQIPGDLSWYSGNDMDKAIRPISPINLNIQQLEYKQEQVRNRVQRALFTDLFMMLANSDRRQITAREIDAREAEKLIALGPVLEGLNQDQNDPLIDIGYQFGVNQNLFGPPPTELEGVELKVEYESIMAQAQKMYGSSSLDKFMGVYTTALQINPDIRHKVDMDNIIDEYGNILSISPKIIRTDEDAAFSRQQEAAQIQKQQNAAMLAQGAQIAKTMSETNTQGDNALTDLKANSTAGQMVGM